MSVLRRVKVANLLKALETIAKIVSDSEAPDVKVIEFKIGGNGKFINIKCAESMDHLWFGGHVNVGDPVVDIYDKRFSASATISAPTFHRAPNFRPNEVFLGSKPFPWWRISDTVVKAEDIATVSLLSVQWRHIH